MTREQLIYKEIRGRAYNTRGKWGISYSGLFCAIRDAGYSAEDADKIIDNMLAAGYIRQSRRANGKTATEQGLSHHMGKYIILKWL